MRHTYHAFTLIELLIVVAIIAILAAIAVPNFLEAQTRAKVSRVKADMRSIATAIEAYATDYNKYPPNDGVFNVVPNTLSTPVAYITNARFVDPFTGNTVDDPNAPDRDLTRYYTYNQIQLFDSIVDLAQWVSAGNPDPGMEGADCPGRNAGAMERYGPWRLASYGPDQKYNSQDRDESPFNPNPLVLLGADIPYDPTNGTRSVGNVLRTQMSSEGIALEE